MRRASWAAAVVLAAMLWSGVAAAGDQVAAIDPAQLFGTSENHSSNLKMFPKWRGMLQLFEQQRKGCAAAQCRKAEWQAIVDGLRGKELMTQLREVNAEINQHPYITDPVNWNMPDYWATPFQFLQKGGDCEDFAIAKYMALREAGVPVATMRIVVLNDLNLGIAHAVLAVYVHGDPYILDNQISKVVPARTIQHYQPVYSINEAGWWLHRKADPLQFAGSASGERKTATLN
jgi:predicted transglutaminase-like cysteine proteinase